MLARLEAGARVTHDLGDGRGVYAYLIEGRARLDTEELATGDAAKVTDQDRLAIEAVDTSELILVTSR